MLKNSFYNELLNKHLGKEIIVDTNLLVIYCIGNFNEALIGSVSVTEKYSLQEYRTIKCIFEKYKIVTLPNILTEVTNLISCKDKRLRGFYDYFKHFITEHVEIFLESRIIVNDESFTRLGLTDSAIINLAQKRYLVISSDLDLCVHLESRGIDVINYNNIKGDMILSKSRKNQLQKQ